MAKITTRIESDADAASLLLRKIEVVKSASEAVEGEDYKLT